MKKINEYFAMRMLEKKLGKGKEQIVKEAASGHQYWPMGLDELDSSLQSQEALAKATIDYFSGKHPLTISEKDILDIFQRAFKRELSVIGDLDMERYRRDIELIFEIYEEE